jgi:peptide/nickel transport system substrate-binding protein
VVSERVPGARVVYERFADYVPRSGGTPDWTAGPKVANFDRVEWATIPDASTAASDLQNGEQDWWDYATADLLPLLRGAKNLKVAVQNPSGQCAMTQLSGVLNGFALFCNVNRKGRAPVGRIGRA